MSTTILNALMARCRVLNRRCPQVADAELVRRFAQQGDASAFEELLERYAPLVWGVCRRMLPGEADREDAFQATFLALVRKPSTIDPQRPLGGWLHTVAVRVARKALVRSRRQRPQAILPEPPMAGDVAEEVGSRELFRAVDEEIDRLPPRLRQPILLCCLQGRTRDEAAEALGCSLAAVKSRLERGRHLLRRRLERRGIGLPAAFLVLGLTGERIRASLWAKTMHLPQTCPPASVAALAEAGLPLLSAAKGKLIFMGLLMVASAAGALGSAFTARPLEMPAAPPVKAATAPAKPEPPPIRVDRHGDPLPEGALARLGTVRFRHGFFVSALAYSPDGKKIAAVGAGRAITLWDAATGKELCQFPNRGQPLAVVFSPDGQTLVTAGRNGVLTLWDASTGKQQRQLTGPRNGGQGLAFAPDGKTLASASYDDTVRLWDPHTGKERRKIQCGQRGVYGLAFAPDGHLVASAGTDGTICLWDAGNGELRRRLTGHEKDVWKVAFSPDGKLLASSSEDGTIRLWDPATGRQVRILRVKLAAFAPLAFSPDGTLLASANADGMIHLWDEASGTEKRHWQAAERRVFTLAFSPDGKTLASGASLESDIRLWDVATGHERCPYGAHHAFVKDLRFSPNGAEITSVGLDGQILQWDLATSTPHRQFSWTGEDLVFALSADGNALAIASGKTHEVRLRDTRTGKPDRVLGKHEKRIQSLAFSPDGRLVASGGDDPIIRVWDRSSGKEVRQISCFKNGAERLCFSPDSKALACGMRTLGQRTGERTLRLWDMDSGKDRCSFDCCDPFAGALAFSPDGRLLASSHGSFREPAGLMVRLWDTATGKELSRHLGNQEEITALAFSPDGKLIVSGAGGLGDTDNSVHVWEAATGRLIRRFESQHSDVISVAFAPNGLTIASGAGDSTILLWDITGRQKDGKLRRLALTPRQLEECWTALADEDAGKAYQVVWKLAAASEQAVPFLQKQLPSVPRPDAETIARLIADLDSENFKVRQRATEELTKFGDAIIPDLRRALEGKPPLEKRRRVQQLLERASAWTPRRLREHRAIQALEHIGTPAAKDVLRALADGAAETLPAQEAQAALRRLAER